MKKLFVAVAALATLLFVSCSKEQMNESKLQGTWTVKTADVKLYENGNEIQIPEALKKIVEDFNVEDTIESMSEGATLTFSKGKVTSAYTSGSEKVSETDDYSINGDTLTIKSGDKDAVNFTIKELTASSLVLTVDILKLAELPTEVKELLKNYSVLGIVTCTK